MRFIEHRIGDRQITRLTAKWLTAGVLEQGRLIVTEEGAPQGAVISPLLPNIYLHYVYDLWVHHWRQRFARGDVVVVRCADDTIVGFEHRHEAEQLIADVNTPPPKGGGFRLRLKAGSVRLAADLGVTAFTAPRLRRTHCPASWAVARHARKFDAPQSKRDGTSPIRRAASHAA
jgi:Reverse transcriptase (RNA-dependent DNA polymerase)